MLVKCRQCRAIISNACCECPWCYIQRTPIKRETPTPIQLSLLGLLIITTVAGLWLGLFLRDG